MIKFKKANGYNRQLQPLKFLGDNNEHDRSHCYATSV